MGTTKKLTFSVVAVEGIKAEAPLFCEIEFSNQRWRTKVVKSKNAWDQSFPLGKFTTRDSLTIRCVAKRSGEVFGECAIALKEFSGKGQYEQEFSCDSGVSFRVQMSVEEEKEKEKPPEPSKTMTRSPSMQFLKDKLSNFLHLNKEDKDPITGVRRASSIRHSRSHTVGLNEAADILEQEPPTAMKLSRTSSEVTTSDGHNAVRAAQKKTRRSRKREKDQQIDHGDVETKNEEPISDEKPKSKKSRDKSSEKDSSSSQKLTDNQPSPGESPTKSRRKPHPAKTTVAESPHRERRRKAQTHDSDVPKSKVERKPRKSKLADEIEHDKKPEPAPPVPSTEDEAPSGSEPTTTTQPRRNTVVLQPLGGDNLSCKIFGSPLSDVMEAQRAIHPDIDIPIFFVSAARVIRERGVSQKGIFRVRGGKIGEVKQLKAQIDKGEPFDEANVNVHIITTLLKAFLRELPVPVLTFENYTKFVTCADAPPDQQIEILREIMKSLPVDNYNLTKFLITLLYDLSLQADETQMTAESLAKVIAPNLLWKKEVDLADLSVLDDTLKGNDVAQVLIVNCDKIFC